MMAVCARGAAIEPPGPADHRRGAAPYRAGFVLCRITPGLAFERAHFGSDPLDCGSPDANRRSGFVDARAAAQKPLNCPFRLSVDRRSRDPKATASMWKSLRKPVLSPGEALEDHRDFRPQRRK
jgi:hypothetical protein